MKSDRLKNLYITHRIYIFSAVVGICCLMLTVLVIIPQTLVFINNQKNEEELINKSKFFAAKAAQLDNYNESDLKKNIQLALDAMPSDKDFVGAIGFLQQVISKSGFISGSIQIGQGSSVKGAAGQSYFIAAQAIGPRSAVPAFINNLENSGRVMKLSTIDVNPNQGSDNVVSISFNVDVLYLPSTSKRNLADTPLPSLSDADNQLLAKFTSNFSLQSSQVGTTALGPRGKANPFE